MTLTATGSDGRKGASLVLEAIVGKVRIKGLKRSAWKRASMVKVGHQYVLQGRTDAIAFARKMSFNVTVSLGLGTHPFLTRAFVAKRARRFPWLIPLDVSLFECRWPSVSSTSLNAA